jgi:hypothetical protein
MLVDVEAGILQFTSCRGPGHGYPLLPASSHTSRPLPALRHLSDVAYISWIMTLGLRSPPLNRILPPSLFIRRNVTNAKAMAILAVCIQYKYPGLISLEQMLEIEQNPAEVRKYVPVHPGVKFGANDDDGCYDAMNACPAGVAPAHFLIQHKHTFGRVIISDVFAFMTTQANGELVFVYRTIPWPEDDNGETEEVDRTVDEGEVMIPQEMEA